MTTMGYKKLGTKLNLYLEKLSGLMSSVQQLITRFEVKDNGSGHHRRTSEPNRPSRIGKASIFNPRVNLKDCIDRTDPSTYDRIVRSTSMLLNKKSDMMTESMMGMSSISMMEGNMGPGEYTHEERTDDFLLNRTRNTSISDPHLYQLKSEVTKELGHTIRVDRANEKQELWDATRFMPITTGTTPFSSLPVSNDYVSTRSNSGDCTRTPDDHGPSKYPITDSNAISNKERNKRTQSQCLTTSLTKELPSQPDGGWVLLVANAANTANEKAAKKSQSREHYEKLKTSSNGNSAIDPQTESSLDMNYKPMKPVIKPLDIDTDSVDTIRISNGRRNTNTNTLSTTKSTTSFNLRLQKELPELPKNAGVATETPEIIQEPIMAPQIKPSIQEYSVNDELAQGNEEQNKSYSIFGNASYQAVDSFCPSQRDMELTKRDTYTFNGLGPPLEFVLDPNSERSLNMTTSTKSVETPKKMPLKPTITIEETTRTEPQKKWFQYLNILSRKPRLVKQVQSNDKENRKQNQKQKQRRMQEQKHKQRQRQEQKQKQSQRQKHKQSHNTKTNNNINQKKPNLSTKDIQLAQREEKGPSTRHKLEPFKQSRSKRISTDMIGYPQLGHASVSPNVNGTTFSSYKDTQLSHISRYHPSTHHPSRHQSQIYGTPRLRSHEARLSQSRSIDSNPSPTISLESPAKNVVDVSTQTDMDKDVIDNLSELRNSMFTVFRRSSGNLLENQKDFQDFTNFLNEKFAIE